MTEGDERAKAAPPGEPAADETAPVAPARESRPNLTAAPTPVSAFPFDGAEPANDPRRVTREAIVLWLSSAKHRALLVEWARTKVPFQSREDLVQDTAEAALRSTSLPAREEDIPLWFRAVMNNCKKYMQRKHARRAAFEDSIGDPDDYAAPTPDDGPEEARLTPWLERETADNPRDRETLDLLKEKAREGLTYEALADRHGIAQAALRQRVNRFVKKYRERRRRYLLSRAVLVLLFVGIVVAIVWYFFLRHVAPPAPSPVQRFVPTAAPIDIPFEPALPSTPAPPPRPPTDTPTNDNKGPGR